MILTVRHYHIAQAGGLTAANVEKIESLRGSRPVLSSSTHVPFDILLGFGVPTPELGVESDVFFGMNPEHQRIWVKIVDDEGNPYWMDWTIERVHKWFSKDRIAHPFLEKRVLGCHYQRGVQWGLMDTFQKSRKKFVGDRPDATISSIINLTLDKCMADNQTIKHDIETHTIRTESMFILNDSHRIADDDAPLHERGDVDCDMEDGTLPLDAPHLSPPSMEDDPPPFDHEMPRMAPQWLFQTLRGSPDYFIRSDRQGIEFPARAETVKWLAGISTVVPWCGPDVSGSIDALI